jgi:GT2 family glycosyltransferase
VSVVICAHAARRWEALKDAVASVSAQTRGPEETIVVIDHNPTLLDRAHGSLAGVTVLPNEGARGLSGARNTGVAAARGEIVAFLDDDACAHPDWLGTLLESYRNELVVGAGGMVVPRWRAGGPCDWLPEEFYWTVGCSYAGLPVETARVRNPLGANMSFRRDAILQAGGFREGIGRLGDTPLGCEETEMAMRATRTRAGSAILYVPMARVDHLVEPDRACWRYFRARCWSEGVSKAIVTRHVGHADGLASEWSYVLSTLPCGFKRALGAARRGEQGALQRAFAVLAGLAITVAGYCYGWITGAAGELLDGDA